MKYTRTSLRLIALLWAIGWYPVLVIAQDMTVPGRIVVEFEPGIVLLPAGQKTASIDNSTILSKTILDACIRIHAYEVEKAFPTSVPGQTRIISPITGKEVDIRDLSQYFVIKFSTSSSVRDVKEVFKSLNGVLSSEPDFYPIHDQLPNDSLFSRQWHLRNNTNQKFDTKFVPTWEITMGEGVKIAIVELGVRDDIEDLHDNIWYGAGSEIGYDTTSLEGRHPTYVAGVAAARTNNAIGVAGVAGRALIMPRNSITTVGRANDIFDAALNGAKVINNSWHTHDWDEDVPYLRNAVRNAFNIGSVILGSMGNEYSGPEHVTYPASLDSFVIAVGSLIYANNGDTTFVSDFQNRGPWIDVTAPGENVWTTSPLTFVGYTPVGGTSFSTPQVSGLAALLFATNPSLTNLQIMNIIRQTATLFSGWESNPNAYGSGMINLYKAVKAAIPVRYIGVPLAQTPTSVPGGSMTNTFMIIRNLDSVNFAILAHTRLQGSLTLNNTPLVIEKKTWLRTGGHQLAAPRTILEPEAEIIIEQSGSLLLTSSEVRFGGLGSCIGLKGGTLQLSDNVELRVNNQGVLANFDPSTINLGNNARIIFESDSKLLWNANSNMIMGSGAAIEVYGTVEVADGVTLSLPPGSNFNLHPGSQVKMGNGAAIYTEGKLHAIGTAQSPIVFQGNNGAWWNGISAKTGNFSGILGDIRLEHVNISNTTKPLHLETPVAAYIANATLNSPGIGIEILPNYNLRVEPPTPPTMQLNAVTINNTSGSGITVENFSDLNIGSCVVSGYQAFAGIALTNSSPKILQSTFQGFEIGIWGVANSSPLLFDQGIGGFNTFTDDIVGAQFEGNSHAALGIDDGTGGQNSFTAYYSYAVALADNSIVNSEWNWYGTPSPTQNLFSITGGSKLYWEPYLTSPPGGNAPMARGIRQKEGDDPRLTLTDPRMKQVLRLRVQSRNTEASALLVAIVADGGPRCKSSVGRLDNCSQ